MYRTPASHANAAPNDIIIDASMPVVVRDSGKMWNKYGEMEDTKCLIPDRCYATMYQECINYVKTNGQFDVSTMGNVVRYLKKNSYLIWFTWFVLSLTPRFYCSCSSRMSV